MNFTKWAMALLALFALTGSMTASELEVGQRFRDCAECPLMVVVPAGSFMMGASWDENWLGYDDIPLHPVSVGSFAVGVYEVTFAEWDACVATGGCGGYRPDDWGWGRGQRPVTNVSWDDTQLYVDWLSRRTGERYCLPSESAWEYVARAGATELSAGGAEISAGSGPNAFGLHGVHEKVWEWVQDCWNESYVDAPDDGNARKSRSCSNSRISRGGTWYFVPRISSLATRNMDIASDRYSNVGFRVARTLTP